ncbi:MAG: hypothetical protein KDC79_08535 [Cyclobacteriaceae bacterium]|nr:hypothetical protein [Cyclobacteriaceae bacterium]
MKYQVADLKPNQRVGLLVKEFASELVSNQDFVEDCEVYLKNEEDDLDKGKTLEESGIKQGDHVFVGRCKKVDVSINYAGKEYTLSVSPSTNARKLRHLALKHFGIGDDDGADLLLWIDKNTYLEDKNMIGSTTDYPKCSVSLLLASKEDIQGAPEEEVLNDHLNSAEYQSGAMEESWGMIENDKRPQWPFVIFWVVAKSGDKYFFRFDLTGYNEFAPTAILWDPSTNTPLGQSKWPNWNKRTKQVFRLWGKQCLYLPCDRLALEGHTDWPQKHNYLIWKAFEDTITKYLIELYQTLNY